MTRCVTRAAEEQMVSLYVVEQFEETAYMDPVIDTMRFVPRLAHD